MKADRVLVPLDGTPFAEMALPEALAMLTDSASATLILVSAVEATDLPDAGFAGAHGPGVREAELYLEAVAARLQARGAPQVVRSVSYGNAARAIVEVAQRRRADVIVMSTHSRRGRQATDSDRVAEPAWLDTKIPILLVSAQRYESGGSSASGFDDTVTRDQHVPPTAANDVEPATID